MLHWACSGGHLDIVEFLVAEGAEIDCLDEAAWTPLMIAASAGHANIVDFLLQKGSKAIELKNDSGQVSM